MKSIRKFTLLKLGVTFTCLLLASCNDGYVYNDEEPDWLGDNVYDYLSIKGNYTTYLALVDALDQKEVLKRTGSKTLFPANDEAFAAFLSPRGISGKGQEAVAQMTPSMKHYLFNASMLNMAYLDNMLSNVSATDNQTGEGQAVRRQSAYSFMDSVVYVPVASVPGNRFWDRFREDDRGVYLADNNARYSIYYTPEFFATAALTEKDWSILSNGNNKTPYPVKDAYVNNSLLLRENMNTTCKNGYIHFAEDVVVPLQNMAECIENNGETATFAYLMDKFCAPYYIASTDQAVKAYYEDGKFNDTVFVRRFFNDTDCRVDPTGTLDVVNNYGSLYYDPSDNRWQSETDMGAMFVPTDEALNNYWEGRRGKFLRDQYASWDDVPTDVLALFIKNHQRRSMLSSLPHSWDIMTDESSFDMKMKEENIHKVYTTCNGLVFVTKEVSPPIDYQCVYAPTLVSDSTTVMRNAIQDDNLLFYLYLRSMENQYNLIVPTDAAMKCYREPISWAIWANTGVDNREIWSFRINNGRPVVDVYAVKEDGTPGVRKNTLDGSSSSDALTKIRNRLNDLLDIHIIVADNESEVLSGFMDSGNMQYGLSKGGTIVHVEGEGASIKLAGGGDLEQGFDPAEIISLPNGDKGIYETDNGHTFFVNHIINDPYKSVYTVLQEKEEYEAFFNLCVGESSVFSALQEEKDIEPIFDQQQGTNTTGVGPIVTSFNNFRYTVLVPTAEAIDKAFKQDPNLWTWERIDAEPDYAVKKAKTKYLLNFIRCHFIDGIVPIAGTNINNREYETAARDENNHFVRVKLTTTGSDLTVTTEDGKQETHAITSDASLYNVMTRDFIVNNSDYAKATQISASSRAVLHVVDNALNYQKK